MKTAGQILKENRQKKKVKLDQVAQGTKIRKRYLVALEKDNYQLFSSIVTIKGFLRNYAQFLGSNPEKILAVFKRDYRQTQGQKLIFQSKTNLYRQFGWSPKKTLVLIVVLFVIALLSYLGYQYYAFLGRPGLEIYSPTDSQQATEEQIIVKGKTNPDNSVAINGYLIRLDDQGEFNYRLRLISGENKIVVEVTNRLGRKTRQERTVYFNKVSL